MTYMTIEQFRQIYDEWKYFVKPKSHTDFWQAKIARNQTRDKEEQRKLAAMGWHCITVWECQLKPKVREQTLQALEYTLNHIFLEDHQVKRYKLPEELPMMAAEPEWYDGIYNYLKEIGIPEIDCIY